MGDFDSEGSSYHTTTESTSTDDKIQSDHFRRFRYSSKFHFVCAFTIFGTGVDNYYRTANFGIGPNFLQYMACFMFIGLPIIHMQICLGQYSQLSAAYIKHLSPIGDGIGYALILSMVFKLIYQGSMAGEYLLYLLSSFQTTLPWRVCPKKYKDICWGGPECPVKPCLTDTIYNSGYIYWNYTYMKGIPNNTIPMSPDFRRIVTCSVIWLTVYFILTFFTSKFQTITRYVFFSGLGLSLLVHFVLFTYMQHSIKGYGFMFQVDYLSSITGKYWVRALIDITSLLGTSKAGFMLIGSLLQPTAPSGILSAIGGISTGVTIFLMTSCFHKCMGSIVITAKLDDSDRHLIMSHKREIETLTVLPTCIGFTHINQLWTVLYFASSICINLNTLLVLIRAIELTFQDQHLNFLKYRKYCLSGFTIFCLFCSILASISGFYSLTKTFFRDVLDYYDIIIAFLFSGLVSWIYGVQRLCDDIHFGVGQQPSKYWKICWYTAPIWFGICVVGRTIELWKDRERPVFIGICMGTLLFPIYAMGIIEILTFVRKRNLVGLFQADAKWGPPDAKERRLRRLFNPRKEIKSSRRSETCRHKCLLGSKILQRVTAEENRNREDLRASKERKTTVELLESDSTSTSTSSQSLQ